MKITAVEQFYSHRRALKSLCSTQSSKTATQNDDPMLTRHELSQVIRRSLGGFPYSRYGIRAPRTLPFPQAVRFHAVPGPLNQNVAASRTIGISCLAEDISFINEMQACFQCDLPCAVQCFRWSLRLVTQFEIRMKRREMQRNI